MTSTEWGLVFAGISALCAIIGIPASIKSCKNRKSTENIKNETQAIKDQIEEYQKRILEKHDLIIIVPKIEEITKITKLFRDIVGKATSKQIDHKTELNYYIDIKDDISEILNDIPEQYSEIRSILSEIKSAFGHCILNQKTLDELDRDSKYGYFYVENELDLVEVKINTLAREIKY